MSGESKVIADQSLGLTISYYEIPYRYPEYGIRHKPQWKAHLHIAVSSLLAAFSVT